MKQNIIIEGQPMIHKLSINKDSLFNLASLKSVYFTERSENNNDLNSIMDDDKAIFKQNLKVAVSHLTGLLARNIDSDVEVIDSEGNTVENLGIVNTDSQIDYYLVVSENHDKNILNSMQDLVEDYLCKKVLEAWYRIDFGSEQAKLDIINAIQYRKKPVRTKIRSLL